MLLVFLEGALSIDNALALSLIVKKLPPSKRKKALFIGLGSAFILRFIAIVIAVKLIHFFAFQMIAALYLIFLAFKSSKTSAKVGPATFWKAVLLIEVTDFLFAFDSITAGVGIVGLPPQIWIIYTGGIIGIIMMRFASTYFIKLMETYPALEKSSHVIVGLTGIKLLFEAFELFPWWGNIVFWVVVVCTILMGYMKGKKPHQ